MYFCAEIDLSLINCISVQRSSAKFFIFEQRSTAINCVSVQRSSSQERAPGSIPHCQSGGFRSLLCKYNKKKFFYLFSKSSTDIAFFVSIGRKEHKFLLFTRTMNLWRECQHDNLYIFHCKWMHPTHLCTLNQFFHLNPVILNRQN